MLTASRKKSNSGKNSNDDHLLKQAKNLDKLDKPDHSSSLFKHTVPIILNFLAKNFYKKFATTKNSSTLIASGREQRAIWVRRVFPKS